MGRKTGYHRCPAPNVFSEWSVPSGKFLPKGARSRTLNNYNNKKILLSYF